ncbi:MAG: pyruvate formate lyase family protein, partial [Planctomycetota bacterium]
DDLEAGRLTRERALLLIESLYLLVNEYTPDGGAVSVMLGGRDASGHTVANDLSTLSLEALRRTRLVYPTVGVCWHEELPAELTDLAIELIASGIANPAFFGDEVIQAGLRTWGLPPAESHYYINSTCVEITPCGSSGVWVASPYFNTCALLLEEIAERADNPPEDFETFLQGYLDRLDRAITDGVNHQNLLRQRRQAGGGKPLQSVFTLDCIERARDIDDGGARYNWVECSFVGLANLADSLYVLRHEVYDTGRLSLARLVQLLQDNFEHDPAELARIAAHPKYGQGNAEVDRFVQMVVQFAVDRCTAHRMHPDDSPFVPGAFVWTMHERLGRQTGATPDGRRRGTPFADGCGPAQGRERFGPTAAILSTTSWDHSPMIGGLAFNMKFNASLLRGTEGQARLKDLVLTYLRRGGFETQVNVTDRDVLLRARDNPHEYRDLVVRIGGYTDYFTRLSPEMQDEILLRTEYQSV